VLFRSLLTAPTGLEAGLMAMPLTPATDGQLPLRICNLSGAEVTAGPLDWKFVAVG
jgi:hypothetical protein